MMGRLEKSTDQSKNLKSGKVLGMRKIKLFFFNFLQTKAKHSLKMKLQMITYFNMFQRCFQVFFLYLIKINT